ncbi:hypothetical protein CK203_069169 [Vitis vinifera]|uniref:Uncharacterized protein n=1 Tax=Vitis vinifera TaxID=29760 RepID=A0A438C1Z4_VITVI|nr:hypothetical protein CK203_069169 [Vitis vinifera]
MGNPKSFKIPINSPLATALKSSISHKLLEFLGNYTDDVLAILWIECKGFLVVASALCIMLFMKPSIGNLYILVEMSKAYNELRSILQCSFVMESIEIKLEMIWRHFLENGVRNLYHGMILDLLHPH